MLGRLLEAYCVHRGIDISPVGSWLLQDPAVERGVEPDEWYVLGDAPDAERPDLAIEAIWTSGGIDRLEVHRKLAVRELWVWKAGVIAVFVLRGERYVEVQASELLPALDLVQLASFVDVHPMTRAVREYRAMTRAVREYRAALSERVRADRRWGRLPGEPGAA